MISLSRSIWCFKYLIHKFFSSYTSAIGVIFKAIAKVPIISTDVGIASQILHESSIYEIETFETAKPNISFAYNEALKYTTSSGMKEFNNMFKNLYES